MNPLRKIRLLTVSLMMLSFLMITVYVSAALAGICPESRWYPVPKMDYWVPAYPEDNTTYWVFDFNTYKNMRLEIKGEFPHARYMNLILYDFNSGEMAAGEHQILEDRDIKPDSGSYNPFLPGVDRDQENINRDYTVYVVREDNDRGDQFKPDGTLKDNILVIPSDLKAAAIFLRVYMPDIKSDDKFDIQGNVDLPEISTFFLSANGPVPSPCPDQQAALLPDRLKEIIGDLFLPQQPAADLPPQDQETLEEYENDVFSYNPGDNWGLYPNGDNPYLIAPLWPKTDQVATVKFKAPTFSATRTYPNEQVDADDDVRYFSVCMGGYKMTNTSECFSDEELKIDADGYVHIAVVPNGEQDAYEFDQEWNVFQWGQHLYPALLFRQIGVNPDFYFTSFLNTNDAFHVETWEDLVENRASKTIGEYAPTGIYCELYQFENNRCGQ